MALQYFLEKLLDILFWSKLTLGSEVSKAHPISGFNRFNIKKNKAKKKLNNGFKFILNKHILVL